ncbi:MAG: hypothetical protein M3137_06505 [Actinomycetota bacterium]|nr:hypothetical protein [Actinomycetota bacterium]
MVAKSGLPRALSIHLSRLEVFRFVSAYPALVAVAVVLSVMAIVSWRWFPSLTILVPILAALTVFEVAVSSGDNYPYERYLLPLFAPATAIAAAGLSRFGWPEALRRGAHRSPRQRRRLVSFRAVSIVLVAATFAGTWVTARSHQEAGTSIDSILAVARALPRVPDLFRSDQLAEHGGIYEYPLAGFMRRVGHPGDLLVGHRRARHRGLLHPGTHSGHLRFSECPHRPSRWSPRRSE